MFNQQETHQQVHQLPLQSLPSKIFDFPALPKPPSLKRKLLNYISTDDWRDARKTSSSMKKSEKTLKLLNIEQLNTFCDQFENQKLVEIVRKTLIAEDERGIHADFINKLVNALDYSQYNNEISDLFKIFEVEVDCSYADKNNSKVINKNKRSQAVLDFAKKIVQMFCD